MSLSRLIRTGTAGLLALQLHVGTTAAAEPRSDWPKLHTNQEMIEDASRAPSIDTKDPLAVLDFVLKSLPARVKVYPTENYYYFWFWHDHVKWAGNLRLDPQERDRGLVNFG